jgi:septum formation inhibitor-activating ATPase MinD
MLELPIIGIVPEDEAIKHSQAIKNAVIYTHPRSLAARSYIDLSKRILGENDFSRFQPPIRIGFISTVLSKLGFR